MNQSMPADYMSNGRLPNAEAGFTLFEVLITLVVSAVGILGFAALQARTHVVSMEANQRSQAVTISRDMVGRINLNREVADTYVTGEDPLGTGVEIAEAVCEGPAGQARDHCQWNELLLGTAESIAGEPVGAMLGARGCVEQIQAADPTDTVCRPAIYQVTVAWQGLTESAAPALACGQGLYGDDRLRRAVATRVVIGLPACL